MSRATTLGGALVAGLGLFFLAAAPVAPVTAVGRLVRVGETRLDLGATRGDLDRRVRLPFLDAAGRLQWDDSLLAARGPAECPGGRPAVRRMAWLAEPRVDELTCAGTGAAAGGPPIRTERHLVGLDVAGGTAWQRPLWFSSGSRRLERWVIGATDDALVLSDLEVVAPATGRTLFAAPTHAVAGEARVVPAFAFAYAALHLPDVRRFLVFEADVTLTRRRGGLSRVDPATGGRDLVWPVETTALGAYWHVDGLALAPGPGRVLVARRFATRGPGGVSLAVLDVAARRVHVEERFGEGRVCRAPRVVVRGAHVGFSYLDETAGEVVLVAYRWER